MSLNSVVKGGGDEDTERAIVYPILYLKHNLIKLIETYALQAAVVSVHVDVDTFEVASLYTVRRNGLSPANYTSFLEELGLTYLAEGDCNAKNSKWGARITKPKGEFLLEAVNKAGETILHPANIQTTLLSQDINLTK